MSRSAQITTTALLTAVVAAIAPAVAVQSPHSTLFTTGLAAPTDFIRMQLQAGDLLLLGTIHNKPQLLSELADLVPALPQTGTTHVALEIPSNQQPFLNQYMATGKGLSRIRVHPAIDCPGYRRFLTRLQAIPAMDRPTIIAMDLPAEQYETGASRDHWMADRLIDLLDFGDTTRILAVAGNLHVFKELAWTPKVIRGHRPIHRLVRNARPQKRIVTIGQTIDAVSNQCDFTRAFGIGPGPVALSLDDRFQAWTLGLGTRIAIRPTPPHRLLDGLIVYPQAK